MKKKTWKRCVCMIGVVLFAVTGLNANNRVPDSPIKKTRSNTFIIEKEKAWEPAGEGVARQIMGYDDITFGRCTTKYNAKFSK